MNLSIVIPVYNSSEILNKLIDEIQLSLFNKKIIFEIVLVNDASNDDSWDKIKKLSERHKVVTGINLKYNFGQHNAIMAGLNHCKGNYIVLMDDDLQHPPDKIYDIYNKLINNYDVCYVRYIKRKHLKWKIFVSKANNIFASFIFKNKPINTYTSSYKGFNRNILKNIIDYKKKEVFLDWIILDKAKNITSINVQHNERFKGTTNYNLKNLLFLWSNMIMIVPILPIRISSFFLVFLKVFLEVFLNKFIKKNNHTDQYIISEYTNKKKN